MKNSIVLLAIAFLVFTTSCKQTAPVTTENMVPKTELEQAKRHLNRLTQDLKSKDLELTELKDRNAELEGQLATVQKSLQDVSKQMEASSDDFGVWFRVQIGAYEGRRIDKGLETTDNMALEEKDELQKVVLGRFRNYDDAKALQEQLSGMGLKDAWIVSYKDGARVTIEEALKN